MFGSNNDIELGKGSSPVEDVADDNSISSKGSRDMNSVRSLTKDQKRIYLNIALERFKNKRRMYSESSQYYERLNHAITIPSVILTSAIGVFSFINSSDTVEAATSHSMSLAIGITSSIITLTTAFSNTFKFSSRKEIHQNVSNEYNRLITEVNTELIQLNDVNFIQYLEDQELKIKANCNYLVPTWIEAKYEKDI